ncbi:MAG: hypothetical protein JNL50_08270 [Phycisphaerae bacterium]|nr:hypothetical protein [Phycisphaerae bacterium]
MVRPVCRPEPSASRRARRERRERTSAHVIRRTRTLFFFVILVTTPRYIRVAPTSPTRHARRRSMSIRSRTPVLHTT